MATSLIPGTRTNTNTNTNTSTEVIDTPSVGFTWIAGL
jgi:hypothetical protein